jgi:hypothetical protein
MTGAMKRRPGRPPLDAEDPSVKVTISLPARHFDALCALARQQARSLPAVIRQAIAGAVGGKNPKN